MPLRTAVGAAFGLAMLGRLGLGALLALFRPVAIVCLGLAAAIGDADRQEIVELRLEIGEVAAAQLLDGGELHRGRVDRLAVTEYLIVKMRAGREAGRADIADQLALTNTLAGPGDDPAHMRIAGLD